LGTWLKLKEYVMTRSLATLVIITVEAAVFPFEVIEPLSSALLDFPVSIS